MSESTEIVEDTQLGRSWARHCVALGLRVLVKTKYPDGWVCDGFKLTPAGDGFYRVWACCGICHWCLSETGGVLP